MRKAPMQSSSYRENTLTISPEIQDLARVKELGELRKVYTITKQNTTLFGIGMLCTFFGIIITPFIFTPSPPPPGIAIAGLISLMVGLYLIFSQRIYARMSARWRIYLWQCGFIHEKGRDHEVFRWDQITTIRRNTDPRISSCKICRQDGYKLHLSSAFAERNELIDIIFEEFARQFAPQELLITSHRNTKTFIYFDIDRQGIGFAQEKYSWHEIQEFITKDGTVTIRKKAE
jgi:xanthosine utilization system XapX-like protein